MNKLYVYGTDHAANIKKLQQEYPEDKKTID